MTHAVLMFLHVLGAIVILGTGIGIAFLMFMAHRSKDPGHVARTAAAVVVADGLFTAPAVVIQPVTGALLLRETGLTVAEGWVLASLALYGLAEPPGFRWSGCKPACVILPGKPRRAACLSRRATTRSTGSGSCSGSPGSAACWPSCG
jgi:hypothetical protein